MSKPTEQPNPLEGGQLGRPMEEQLARCQAAVEWIKNKAVAPPLDPVVEANRELLRQRSQVGITKYGVTLEEANLTEDQILLHALEETLDLANYLQKLLRARLAANKP